MKRTSFKNAPCPIARSLDAVGEWWMLLIVRDVFGGIRRFDELLADLGISRNVLTDRLQAMVASGILEKKQYQEKPVRYEYHLSAKGRELLPVLGILTAWGNRWLPVKSETPVRLIHEKCGHELTLHLECAHCSEAVSTLNVRPENFANNSKIPHSLAGKIT